MATKNDPGPVGASSTARGITSIGPLLSAQQLRHRDSARDRSAHRLLALRLGQQAQRALFLGGALALLCLAATAEGVTLRGLLNDLYPEEFAGEASGG